MCAGARSSLRCQIGPTNRSVPSNTERPAGFANSKKTSAKEINREAGKALDGKKSQ
jgi:hypothetical protein